ncbi:alpha/beta fold hydrolase [Streptomyces sp. NPDC005955]|uniref:alpha/beta hydrolase n=1 Tax=Streptomyces sp. NPDC005955 TaxID=3364738 RepID=UPI0036A39EE0
MARYVRSAALLAAVVMIAGCSSGSDGADDPPGDRTASRSPAPAPSDTAGGGLPASLTEQRLSWGACEAGADGEAPDDSWRCADLKVPLDYTKPDGKTIDIALIRAGAKDEGSRIGSLVFNFGGPGGSGISMLPSFAPEYDRLQKRYDLVSFDPRGVGDSEGVRCRTDEAIQAAEEVDLSPDGGTEERAFLADAADFAAGCERGAGELLAHLSTDNTARDMDLMRHVLGDDALHYFGISYGTQLGGAYAHLFPGRVGRLVFDAVVDPTADGVAQAKNQTRGFQRALDNYLKDQGQDPAEGSRAIADLLERIDAEPLPTSGDRELTQTLATIGIVITLYSEQSWPALTEALEAAEDGDGSALLALADAYNERDEAGGYSTQSHSQRAISCRDSKDRTTPEQARASLAEFREISPVFGEFLGWDTAGWCHQWPVPGLQERSEVSAPGAAPILVIGNTGDPATPYEGAGRMADGLGEGVGVLMTWKGEGHGAYGNGSDCVDGAVDAYLLDGRAPKDGKVCS